MAGCDAPLPPGVDELVSGEMVGMLARNMAQHIIDKNNAALKEWRWACVRCTRIREYMNANARVGRESDAPLRECGVLIDPDTRRGTSECGVRHVYEPGPVSWLAVKSYPVGSVRESSNQRRA